MTPQIPKEYDSCIWQYTEITNPGTVFVLEDKNKTSKDRTVVTYISFTPNGPATSRPIIFKTPIEAELYKNYILKRNPSDSISGYTVAKVNQIPYNAGYRMEQCVGRCPVCDNITIHGSPSLQKFYCPNCQTAFDLFNNPD